jgi:nucleotide-binding universal stress UspA family protein
MYSKILVPLDASKLSEGSLDHVKNIVQGNPGIEVILMTVHKPINQIFAGEYLTGEIAQILENEREKQDKELEQKLETYLTETAGLLMKQGITVKTHVAHPEPPKSIPEMILDYAEANKVDLIIMTTHGRSGIKRWAFGSVAGKLIHISKIPVLIIPPIGFRT